MPTTISSVYRTNIVRTMSVEFVPKHLCPAPRVSLLVDGRATRLYKGTRDEWAFDRLNWIAPFDVILVALAISASPSVFVYSMPPGIDDRLNLAVALVQRAWPAVDGAPNETAEVDVAELAGFDPHRRHPLAVTMGRVLIEIARAAGVAVAVLQVRPFHVPVNRPD
jgi:hypothetical protein